MHDDMWRDTFGQTAQEIVLRSSGLPAPAAERTDGVAAHQRELPEIVLDFEQVRRPRRLETPIATSSRCVNAVLIGIDELGSGDSRDRQCKVEQRMRPQQRALSQG